MFYIPWPQLDGSNIDDGTVTGDPPSFYDYEPDWTVARDALRDKDTRTGVRSWKHSGNREASITIAYARPVTASSVVLSGVSDVDRGYDGTTWASTLPGVTLEHSQDLKEWEPYHPVVSEEISGHFDWENNYVEKVLIPPKPVTARYWRVRRRQTSSYQMMGTFRLECGKPHIQVDRGAKIECVGDLCDVEIDTLVASPCREMWARSPPLRGAWTARRSRSPRGATCSCRAVA